jgi:Major Facilitator Superfamily
MQTTDAAVPERPSPRPPLAAVLGSRPYLLLWSAQFASLLAGFFNYVAVAWLVLQLTGSTLAVGSVLAAASIPSAILMLLGGAVSDRFSPRMTMLAAGLVRGAVMVVLAALTIAQLVQLWELFAAAVIVGSTTAFFIPAGMAMLPRVVSTDQLPAGNALLNLSRTGAMVLGSAAAGVLVAAVGAGAALGVDAAGSLLAAILVIPLPSSTTARPGSAAGPLADIRDGLRYAWHDVPLRTALIVVAVLNLGALGAIEVGLPALAHVRFSEGAAALGTSFAAWGIGSTAGSLLGGTRTLPGHFGRFMVGTVALIGAGVAAAGIAPTLAVLIVIMVVLGVVEGIATTYLLSWLQGRTDPAMQGRVMAIAMLASVGLEPVALAAAGALASRDLGLLFWASAAAIELTAFGAALSRSVRRM